MSRHRSKYKLKIIKMIIEGYDNHEIMKTLQCSRSLPGQIRRWWEEISEEEQDKWLDLIEEPCQPKAEAEKGKPKSSFRSPAQIARGPYFISRG